MPVLILFLIFLICGFPDQKSGQPAARTRGPSSVKSVSGNPKNQKNPKLDQQITVKYMLLLIHVRMLRIFQRGLRDFVASDYPGGLSGFVPIEVFENTVCSKTLYARSHWSSCRSNSLKAWKAVYIRLYCTFKISGRVTVRGHSNLRKYCTFGKPSNFKITGQVTVPSH